MERPLRDGTLQLGACAALVATACSIGDVRFAYAAVFGVGMLAAYTEIVRWSSGPASVWERIGARAAGGVLTLLALAMVLGARHGVVFPGALAPVEMLQDIAAASLAAALLMRLPLLVALGNAPLVVAAGESRD
jgi:uncharacterized membrane protein